VDKLESKLREMHDDMPGCTESYRPCRTYACQTMLDLRSAAHFGAVFEQERAIDAVNGLLDAYRLEMFLERLRGEEDGT
jgi:hypothetical protein